MTERIKITPQSAFEDGRMQGAKDFFFSANTRSEQAGKYGKMMANSQSSDLASITALLKSSGSDDAGSGAGTAPKIATKQAESESKAAFSKGDAPSAILIIDAADAGDAQARAGLEKQKNVIMKELDSAMKKGETDLSTKIAAILPTLTSGAGPKHEGLVKTKVELVKNLVVGCAADINLKVRNYEDKIKEQTRDMIKKVKVGVDLLQGAELLNRDPKSEIGSKAMATLLEKTIPGLKDLIKVPEGKEPKTFLSLVFSDMLKGYFGEVVKHLEDKFIKAAIAVDDCLGKELKDHTATLNELVTQVEPVTKEDQTNINELIAALTQLNSMAGSSTAMANLLNRMTTEAPTYGMLNNASIDSSSDQV